jgi:putative ABC transport system permease protein
MIGAMVFGLLGVMLMVGFVNAMVENMVDNAIKYQTGHLQVHNSDFLVNEELKAWLPEAETIGARIASFQGVAGVSVRQVIDGMIGSATSTRGIRINGIKGSDETRVTSLQENIIEGTNLPDTGRNPVVVSRRIADKLKLRLGSKVVLTFSDTHGEVSGAAFRVCGFFNTPSSGFDEGNIFIRRADISSLAGLNESHEIAVRLASDDNMEKVKEDIIRLVGEKGTVRDWSEIQPLLATMVGSMGLSNGIIIGIFVLALGFGIVNIMLMSVFERTREFGMLMAVGMNKSGIVQLIAMESVFLGTVGSFCGIAASVVLLGITGHFGLPLGAMAEGLGTFGVDTVLYPKVSLSQYFLVLLTIIFTSLMASLYPTRLILKKPPHVAMAKKL